MLAPWSWLFIMFVHIIYLHSGDLMSTFPFSSISVTFALAQENLETVPNPFGDTPSSPAAPKVEQPVCTPYGRCEPCPDDAVRFRSLSRRYICSRVGQLKEPFCQPFGNRQLMHCTSSTPSSSVDAPTELDKSGNPVTGLVPAWASCGRIPARERADFWEFVACNAFIAACALGAVVVRGRKISALATRELAARIGVGVRAV